MGTSCYVKSMKNRHETNRLLILQVSTCTRLLTFTTRHLFGYGLLTPVIPVTAVTVSQDGWGRTVTWTGMTVCQVPAKMQARALTSSMVSSATVAKASEVSACHRCTSLSNQ